MPTKQAIQITGLFPVVEPKALTTRQPGQLTNEEVAEIVRFPGPRDNEENYSKQLVAIQAFCQWWANVGKNPKLVGIEDFDIAIIQTTHDPVPGKAVDGIAEPDDPNTEDIFVDAGAALVVKHKDTGKTGEYDLDPPKGFSADNYYRQTASALIGLGDPDPEPVAA